MKELERDLELERRKVRELQDGSRDRDKEYAKLKACIGPSILPL
jgi:E3 ubiquitin-protein ligase CCNP1IP1